MNAPVQPAAAPAAPRAPAPAALFDPKILASLDRALSDQVQMQHMTGRVAS